MSEGIAKTKGIGFTNVRAFTVGRFGGEAGWSAVIDKLEATVIAKSSRR